MLKQVVQGVVEYGAGQGKKLGAPTANLPLSAAIGLTKGLYACWVEWEEKRHSGLFYYGINSLTGVDCCEVHVLNETIDLYGVEIKVVLEKYLREPREFSSAEALQQQIAEDVRRAQDALQK